ncbi:hypothetical protein [Sedimenticola hydrogenitrophicus]|uniref:hypothetical protein n=1 Tax=Sedimenticola hydrogenitrophicus TaxID=2967975 RepID=UPI0021A6800E|nr:hypothetical protein [Sedimenticola hydrogenitrophicus]
MTTHTEYEYALLSEAAYADFWDERLGQVITIGNRVKTALTTSGFSNTQAEAFITQWRVISHQPNTGNGFSATVFESIEHPGEFVFAMRGTEPTAQWGTDITLADIADIGADGIALNQAIDLINYYQRLTTSGTDMAVQYDVYEGIMPPPPGTTEYQVSNLLGVPYYRYVKVADPVQGLGVIPDTVGTIDIAGHSLGGHLALILSRFDPNRVDDVHTYNAPGFDTGIIGSDDTEWFSGRWRKRRRMKLERPPSAVFRYHASVIW